MLLSESKNLHMEHIEDNILNGGVDGARQTINFIRSLRDMLAGNSPNPFNISVKWDGAPSIFAGIDPRDGAFFVAKKSIFNDEPKLYKTVADIDADLSGDLARKFRTALALLPDLKIDGIIQGDFLFTQSDLETRKINGENYVTFHPNTIVYAIPTNSDLAKEIRRSKMGIVWHTQYEGTDIHNLKAIYNRNIVDLLSKSRNVWSVDATYRDVSGAATMTSQETAEITALLSRMSRLFDSISRRQFDYVSKNSEYLARLKSFINRNIREGRRINDPLVFVQDFNGYLANYYGKMADQRATERGKNSVYAKLDGIRKSVDPDSLVRIFQLYNMIIEAKMMLINKLNKTQSLNTFFMTNNGFEVTGQEGYVVADRLGGNAVKLVDRLQFSRANFTDAVTKGFER